MDTKIYTPKERVEIERKELIEKLDKLKVFLTTEKFKSLNQEQQALLTNQSKIMTEYVDCLENRLAIWGD